MKRKVLIISILALVIVGNIAGYYFLMFTPTKSVNISEVNHEVLFSGIQPASPSDTFFSYNSSLSGFSVSPGGTFNDTIAFYSVPSLPTFDIVDISVESPTSSSFYIATMNGTLPLKVSLNQASVAITLSIRVPDSGYNGQVTVVVSIGP